MSFAPNTKTEFPCVYASEPILTSPRPSKSRMMASRIAKIALAVIAVACCVGLSLQVVHDKENYDSLLADYNALLEQSTGITGAPLVAHDRRAVDTTAEAASATTTTTVTQGTTIIVDTTAAYPSSSSVYSAPSLTTTSSLPASSSGAPYPSLNSTSTAGGSCGTGSRETVTITVTSSPLFSSPPEASFVSFSVYSSPLSSLAPITVVETHLTTSTIYVTGSVASDLDSVTVTETATAGDSTTTEVVTIHASGNVGTIGTDSHTVRYPNSTIAGSVTPGTGMTTASFTLTLPGGTAGSTGSASSAGLASSTSSSSPQGTSVTFSGASKTDGAFAGIAAALVVAFALVA